MEQSNGNVEKESNTPCATLNVITPPHFVLLNYICAIFSLMLGIVY